MTESTSVTLTFGYADTDFTRKYKFENVANAALSGIADKCKAINQSLAGGTAGGLSSFFLSDDGNTFCSIVAAQSDCASVNVIDLNAVANRSANVMRGVVTFDVPDDFGDSGDIITQDQER